MITTIGKDVDSPIMHSDLFGCAALMNFEPTVFALYCEVSHII